MCSQPILISAKDHQKIYNFLGIYLDVVSHYFKTVWFGWQASINNIQQTTFIHVVVGKLNDGIRSKLLIILICFILPQLLNKIPYEIKNESQGSHFPVIKVPTNQNFF